MKSVKKKRSSSSNMDMNLVQNLPITLHPLYNQKKARQKMIRQFLKEKAVKARILLEPLPEPYREEIFIPVSQEKYANELRQHAKQVTVQPIFKTWEKRILNLLPKSLKLKFPSAVQSNLSECKTEWNDSLHSLVVKTIIRDAPGKDRLKPTESFLKHGGKTSNYHQFLKLKKLFEEKLIISNPIMKLIIDSSVKEFPQFLVNFDSYRNKSYFVIDDLKQLYCSDLEKSVKFIIDIWYPELIKQIRLLNQNKMLSNKKYLHILNCASKLVSIQIVQLMRRSIEHIIDITGDCDKIPLLYITLNLGNNIYMEPSFEDISIMFHNFSKSIINKFQDLLDLKHILDESTDFIYINMNDSIYIDYEKRLQNNLDKNYSSVKSYIVDVETKFLELLKGDSFDIEINTEEDLQEAFDKIEHYKLLNDNISSLLNNEYFDICKISQNNIITSLKERLFHLRNKILDNLCSSHKDECYRICSEFETIYQKATITPSDATELIELGTYCAYVKGELLVALSERIAKSATMMTQLIDLTVLTEDHINVNTKMINWLKDIVPILEKSAINYETIKYEMEELLVAKTNALLNKITNIFPYLNILDEMDDINCTLIYLEDIRRLVHWIDDCEKDVAWINKEETVFKFPVSQYMELEELKSYVLPFYDLMYLLHKWRRSFYSWMDGPFEYINNKEVEMLHEMYFREFTNIFKDYKAKIKQQIIDGKDRHFKGSVDDPDPMNYPAPMKLCTQALNELKEWRPWVQLVNIMCNPALRPRHLDEMSKLAGTNLTPNAGTTIRKMIKMDLWDDMQKYEIISVGATKELDLITNLEIMKNEWKDVKFEFGKYKDTDITVLSKMENVQALLDDHLVKAITMRGSTFAKPFEKDVKSWYEKLNCVNQSIEEWGKVQTKWLYFLPLFSSQNIKSQMPAEASMFQEVDKVYKKYMEQVLRDPNVLRTAGEFELLEALRNSNDLLEKVNEGVNNYIEKKRLYFGRFFFLSTDEILEILSETSDPTKVQPHLKKCFEGINILDFDDNFNILGMISKESENVRYKHVISTEKAEGSVEKWLLEVENEMLFTIRDEIRLSYADYATKDRKEWIKCWQGMVVLCVSQIYWAMDIHKCLTESNSNTLEELFKSLGDQLNDLVKFIRLPTLSNLLRITLKALIVIDVHAKDVVQEMISKEVSNDTDFNWLSQLRYYWENDNVNVKIINAVVKYAYEYLGNTDRLVITPLTDRCYRTLIGAYSLHLNGAPEGPAGTGKTETTKDLAKALAIQCIVFNCSDGLDYKSMGRFFKGLACTGAWACFDEFNRIDVEVLSVVAQQILSIVQAVRQKVEKFNFEGTMLVLNPACYVCITMNPGYAGRSELPDNLKVLFRTVAMMVPDYAMIGEISLYSYGYLNARNLAVKIVTTYRLCSEQLSSQNHYDYGMRAVKSVLLACGDNKILYPDENEEIIMLKSLRDVNLAKFLSFDIPLFDSIILDVFPGISLPEDEDELFNKLVEELCEEMNITRNEYFLLKLNQTKQMMAVRHGFMMVGDPFSGKSTILTILYKVMSKIGNFKGDYFRVINPKAIHIDLLFGCYDRISNEWFDGIVGKIFREFALSNNPEYKWIIFDGPVDAVWIENMNTVLDDSKKLCLNSGEVIAMPNSMSMIFEVMDLAQASPATVSRCGMIYLESTTLGYKPFVKSWVKNNMSKWKEGYESLLIDLCDWLFPQVLSFLKRTELPEITGGNINMIITCLNLIDMLMTDAINEDDTKYFKTWIQASFIFGMVWGFGGNLPFNSKIKFDECLKEIWKGEQPIPESLEKIDVSVPLEGMLYDYVYQYKQKGVWKEWQELVKNVKIIEKPNFQDILIPTVDALKTSFMLDLHIKYKKPIILIGPTGTGKTFYMRDYMTNKLSMDSYTPILLTFTTTTLAKETQELMISKLYKKRNNRYGPSKGKEAIVFIDDVSMPAKEIYGAQPAIEVLRQYLDYATWYDLKSLEPIYLLNILLFATMGLVGGSKQLIYARFLRHFDLFSFEEFSDETLKKIFMSLFNIGLRRNGFGSDVTSYINSIVNATLHVYASVRENLLPTVSQPHYMFNLRDFGRIIHGCSLIKKDADDDRKVFVKLWIHETLRVFGDRLISDNDRRWLFDLIKSSTNTFFKEQIDVVCENYKDESGKVNFESLNSLMFGTYLDIDSLDEDKKYEEIPSIDALYKRALDSLEEFNSKNKRKMNIVLFKYALEHLSRICRILSIPGGSSLLVGMGGSGRQSLIKLACTMSNKMLFQPEITKDYSLKNWREDIKKLLKQVGGESKETILLLSENQIIDETFIQDVDNLLNSGEIPNLFDLDEQQEILEMVRLDAQGGNRLLDVSPLQVLSFFTARCKVKLHICISLSPVGNAFRNRLRLYPALINCCTIDWFDLWPEDALKQVAHRYMEDVNLPDDVKMSSAEMCKNFHTYAHKLSEDFYESSSRKVYVTSGSYLNLINLFSTLISAKQKELIKAKLRYTNGLEKLGLAADAVSNMQQELNELKPQLIVTAGNVAKMMEEIEKETIEADKAASLVREDEKIANEQAAAAQALKKDCEADLALAIPILEDAIASLNTLKPADITLVKSMKNPPAAIKLVMAAVCVMMSVPPDRLPDPANPGRMLLDYWGPSKRLLGDMALLQNLKDYDKDNIPVAIMVKIRKEYLPHKDFKPPIVAKASTAAEGLCKWVIAMDMYDALAKVVAPKKAKLLAAENEFAATMAILNEKKAMVARLEKRVADLNASLEEANRKRQQLENEVQMCINKLNRAEKLIGGLGGEKTRWTQAAEHLQYLYDNLAGDILLSCGIIAYLSPFPATMRADALDNWKNEASGLKIPYSDEYVFTKILGNDIDIQNWYISGLPRDQVSTDSALIQDISLRWSLFIDPQGQANKWIKTMEKPNSLKVIKLSDFDYMKNLQSCMELGIPALIENVLEELYAPLDPILMKNLYTYNNQQFMTLGDIDIEYNNKFRLYITTKMRNPRYSPEVYNKVTIINFALSINGLEDQLLGIVVAKERPDLQEQREMLIVESAKNNATLKSVENKILRTLQESEGDILEDEGAIEILDSSKLLADDIMERKEASKETEKIINNFRQSYYTMAQHSANLYYSVTDLPIINHVYQFSLTWFINLYVHSIRIANKSNDLNKRLTYLKNTFTYTLYCNVCRSLFEKDKLMFSFVLCCKMMMVSKEIDELEYNFLLTGGLSIEEGSENPISWLPNKSWNDIIKFDDIEKYKGFKMSFVKNSDSWKTFYDSAEPQNEVLPKEWKDVLTPFAKVLLIKMIRPDKLRDSIMKFVEDRLGSDYVKPPPFDIVKSYTESNCLVPLIFILSPGSDPILPLSKLANKMGYTNKLGIVSLGQGQGPIAKALIKQAQKEGGWVCLQNCHLSISWLPELENIIEAIDLTNTDLSFRLWLTTYSSDKIPQSILQNGIKMTNESPSGLKNNLTRLYTSEPLKDPTFYEGCPGKFKIFSKLLFGISYFHAVVQERKEFGALGWNIPYGFDDSDFHISVMQLQIFLNDYEDVPYVALSYLIGECNYGGRVTDDWDRRLIVTLLKDYINSEIIADSKYQFSNMSSKYNLPIRYEYQDYLEHIGRIPNMTPPEVFGLNMNAGIFRNYNNSMGIIDSLLKLQGTSSNERFDQHTDKLLNTISSEITSKLSKYFDLDVAKEKYPIDYNESMNIFLVQEMERFNKLMKIINTSLINIQKSIKGIIVMTPDIEEDAQFLLIGKVPNKWMKISYPSLKPLGSYITDLVERIKTLDVWFENGKPTVFWISGFYFTQAFLTGGMQNYARRFKIPIDKLTFDCEIVEKVVKECDNGFYINGLFIDGARWNSDKGCLDEQHPKVLNGSMPVIRLFSVLKSEFDEGERYKCPIYKTSERRGIIATTGHSTNFVLPLMLPSDKPSSHWIKRSAAMILQLND